MKNKKFKGKLTETMLTNGYYGDEGICIQIQDEDHKGCFMATHIFKNKNDVKRLIKQLKKSLKDG